MSAIKKKRNSHWRRMRPMVKKKNLSENIYILTTGIRETLALSTDADKSKDTIFSSSFSTPLKCRGSAVEVLWKCCGSSVAMPVKCHWSANSQQPTATAKDLPLLTPHYPLSTPFFKVVSSQANIRNTFLDQTSPWHAEVGVLWCHKHTDIHCNSKTKSAQWAESVKIIGRKNLKSILDYQSLLRV